MNTFIILMLVGFAAAASPARPTSFNVYEVPSSRGSSPAGVPAVRKGPMIALAKSAAGKYNAYLLEHGFATLANSPASAVRHLKEMLVASNAKSALVFNPATLFKENSPTWEHIRALPIAKFDAPEDINVHNMAKYAAGEMPIVFFCDDKELASRKYPGLVRQGAVDLATLEGPSPYPFRNPAYNPATKSHAPEFSASHSPAAPTGMYNAAPMNPAAPGAMPAAPQAYP